MEFAGANFSRLMQRLKQLMAMFNLSTLIEAIEWAFNGAVRLKRESAARKRHGEQI
ncbi:MAG TPA: hypothetical protein VLM90_09245 [Candidatus Deferrimicrobium sp.]|nr:hypothetical protein [Candidatus Deferrimicrobium sp.]